MKGPRRTNLFDLAGRDEKRRTLAQRMGLAALFVILTATIGTAGFYALGDGLWSWEDCLYMTLITVSTVGFAETLPGIEHVAYARAWTVVLILFGSGILLYFVSTLTAFIVEVDLGGALRRTRMRNTIDQLQGHFVVCGCGNTGLYIVRELIKTDKKFVVVDHDEVRILEVQAELDTPFLFITGDATDDDTLRDAGVDRAAGVVAALTTDPQNLYVTLSARALNDHLRIVAKAVEVGAREKMIRAGADSVVLPHLIGGMRMVREMIRPQVVEFLDRILEHGEHPLSIDAIVVRAGSALDGLPLNKAGLRARANALLLAIEHPDGRYEYNPPPDTMLGAGMRLILIAPNEGLRSLRVM